MVADDDRVRTSKLAATGDMIDTTFVEIACVDAVQSFYVGIATDLQCRPVMAANDGVETVVRRVFKVMCMLCRIPHHFFGYATHVDAGAAERARFDGSGARAILSRSLCMGKSTTAATNYQ